MMTARLYRPRMHTSMMPIAKVLAFMGMVVLSGGLSRAILP